MVLHPQATCRGPGTRAHRACRSATRAVAGILVGLGLLALAGGRASADNIRLTLGSSVISFPTMDPNAASAAAQENPISVSVSGGGNGNWTLTVLAAGDLVSGTDRIAVQNLRWTATGAAFVSGVVSKTSSQTVGSGTVQTLPASGTLSFFLNQKWSFATGSYSQSITFTVATF